MKTLALAENVSAAATSTQTAVVPRVTPFLAGRDVIYRVDTTGITGTPTILLESSADNVTWSTLQSYAVPAGATAREFNVKVQPYMRTRVSVAGSAGIFSAYLNNGT